MNDKLTSSLKKLDSCIKDIKNNLGKSLTDTVSLRLDRELDTIKSTVAHATKGA